jgi:ElaB/YqjD/DUF883 family membrane-anchored ribosome-binding protein
MVESNYLSSQAKVDVERSSAEIKKDIATDLDNISAKAGDISERIEEKLDWREHVKESPFLALGAAAGVGFLASGMVFRRTGPLEHIFETAIGSLIGRGGRSLIQMALFGIATRTVVGLIKKAALPASLSEGPGARPQTCGRGRAGN